MPDPVSNIDGVQESIKEIDSMIGDMNEAMNRASKGGKGLGDYDLSTETANVQKERVVAEQIAQEQLVPPTTPAVTIEDTQEVASTPIVSEETTESQIPIPKAPSVNVTEGLNVPKAIHVRRAKASEIPTEGLSRDHKDKVVLDHQANLKVYKGHQDKLIAAFLKKYPDAKADYDSILSMDPESRKGALNKMVNEKDRFLSEEKQIEVLGGKTALLEYIGAKEKVFKFMNNDFNDFFDDTAGSIERKEGGIENFGLKHAAAFRSTAPKKSVAEAQQDILRATRSKDQSKLNNNRL